MGKENAIYVVWAPDGIYVKKSKDEKLWQKRTDTGRYRNDFHKKQGRRPQGATFNIVSVLVYTLLWVLLLEKKNAYRSADVANDAVILGYLQVLHISAKWRKEKM